MSRPRPIGSSRESTSNLSQRSGRLSESQNHYVTPPNGGRSTRTHSIAVPRGVSGPGAIGRPIMWTKQATLQKNNGLAYASQPTDGASQLGLSQAFALSQSNGSSFQPASHHNSGNLTPGNVPHSLASSSNRVGSTSGLGAGAHAPPQPHHQHQQHDERESRADIAKHPSKSRTHHKSDSSGSSVGAPPAVQAEATHAGSSGAGTTGGDAAPASGAASVAARAITTRQNTAANASVAQSEGVLGHVLSMNALTRNSENISLVSSQPYRDILKKIGHPLRGPVLQEFGVHYSFFLLVLFVAWQTSWAPQIRFYLAVFYFFISCFCLTTSRLIFSRLPNSSIPFYISFIPLAVLIYISREAHQIVMMLWFISFLIIFLQSGHPQLAKHLLFFCIAYVVVYVAMLGLMVATYKSDCFTLYCSVALSTAISPLYEGLLLIDFLFIMGIFNRLERFIKLNASTLLDRENYMQHLYIANMDLKRQLRNAKIDNEVDLEAPLTRATQILGEIKDTQDLEESIIEEIDFIIGLLSSDKLFQPDLFQNSNDADVHDWLKDMLLADKGPAKNDGSQQVALASPMHSAAGGADTQTATASEAVPGFHSFGLSDKRAFDILSSCDDPEFDVFDLEVATSGHALYFLGWYLFRQHSFAERLQVDETRFRNWLIKIESGYRRSNSYHNSTHAADVTHSMNYFCTRPRIWSTLKPEEQFAAIVSPIVHDYMHPGVNNAFLIATSSALALRYNDQSVLEHFHCASLFEMANQEELDIFASLTTEQRKSAREMIVSMVLATDMAFHFDWIGKFKSKLSGAGFNFENKADKKMVLNIAIKCADVNNPTKPQASSRRWTQLIMEEFFRQGDEEKSRGLPISTFMNRETTDTPKCQTGFIDYIVHPLYEAWASFMKEDVDPHMRNIQANKAFWKSCGDNPALYTMLPIPTFTVSPLHPLMASPAPPPAPAPAVSGTGITLVSTAGTSSASVAIAPAAVAAARNRSLRVNMSSAQDNNTIDENPQSPGVDGTGQSGFPKPAPASRSPSAPLQALHAHPADAAVQPLPAGVTRIAPTAVLKSAASAASLASGPRGGSASEEAPAQHIAAGTGVSNAESSQGVSGAGIPIPVNPHGKHTLPPVTGSLRGLKEDMISPLDRPSLPKRIGDASTRSSAVVGAQHAHGSLVGPLASASPAPSFSSGISATSANALPQSAVQPVPHLPPQHPAQSLTLGSSALAPSNPSDTQRAPGSSKSQIM